MFEGLVSSNPRRFDLWLVYAEKERKACEKSKDSKGGLARRVFLRAASLNWSTKKTKTLFKKFLEFEMDFGGEKEVAKVKKMATDYVNSQK